MPTGRDLSRKQALCGALVELVCVADLARAALQANAGVKLPPDAAHLKTANGAAVHEPEGCVPEFVTDYRGVGVEFKVLVRIEHLGVRPQLPDLTGRREAGGRRCPS